MNDQSIISDSIDVFFVPCVKDLLTFIGSVQRYISKIISFLNLNNYILDSVFTSMKNILNYTKKNQVFKCVDFFITATNF